MQQMRRRRKLPRRHCRQLLRTLSPFGASGVSGCFFIGLCPAHALLGRLSQAIKRIQVSVAVKSATKCTLKCVRCALHTLSRTLNRFLNRHPYPVTLNRSTYTIPTCLRPVRDSSIEDPPLIPEAPSFCSPCSIPHAGALEHVSQPRFDKDPFARGLTATQPLKVRGQGNPRRIQGWAQVS